MTNGVDGLRAGRRKRATRNVPPPRHPAAPDAAKTQASEDQTPPPAPHLSVAPDPAPEPTHQVQQSAPEPPLQPAEPAPSGEIAYEKPNQPTTGEPDRGQPTPTARETDRQVDESDRGNATGTVGAVELPDLDIDWTDPLMHVPMPTRVSVANSVGQRFKAVADQPGQPPQTELILEAVNQHLDRLPQLVLERRPEERPQAAGFFLRRAAVQKQEPWVAIYMRPLAGEVEALGRIVEWVSRAITEGHPGRKKTTRSEVVTAALAASYPEAATTD